MHPVERALELIEQDPELAGLAGNIRDYIPVITAIVAPRQRVAAGELPLDSVGLLIERVSQHWQQAKSEYPALFLSSQPR